MLVVDGVDHAGKVTGGTGTPRRASPIEEARSRRMHEPGILPWMEWVPVETHHSTRSLMELTIALAGRTAPAQADNLGVALVEVRHCGQVAGCKPNRQRSR